MLYWALVFLLVAIVAGAVGFGGVAVAFAGLAKIIFFIFLVLLVISLVAHVRAEPPGSDPQLNDEFFTNPRTITPAPPVVAYGSMKIKLW